ncbi:MAG: AAA family ATPase [Candidatus Paceibacterota bacterium]|jgi:broad-specificity NMP kinase
MKKFYITGISGTGKTAISLKLKQKGLNVIDLDDENIKLCHWKNKKTRKDSFSGYGTGLDFLNTNGWYCDIEKLKFLINSDDKNNFFVVGIAENQNEFLNLFDKIFLLQCDEAELFRRIDNRKDNDFGKNNSEKEYIKSFRKKFENDLINKKAIVINSNDLIDSIVDKIISNT